MELKNAMGILDKMGVGVYSIVETQWDTTNPSFKKYINTTKKRCNRYAQVEFEYNMDEQYNNSWKPGGTLIGVSG